MTLAKRNTMDGIKKNVGKILSVFFLVRRRSRGESVVRARAGGEDDCDTVDATFEVDDDAERENGTKRSRNSGQGDDNASRDDVFPDHGWPLESEPTKKDLRPLFFLDHVVA